MTDHVFTGFGFGPIQGGLFAKEAFESGNFSRIAIAEIDAGLVNAVRANNGSYYVNVARSDGIDALKIDNVQLLNPNVEADKRILLEVLAESTEIVTCLPSVNFYDAGEAASVASRIAQGLKNSKTGGTIIYTAENNNHAAEILEKSVAEKAGQPVPSNVQFLNTVIAKMSRVVAESDEIAKLKLAPIAPGLGRAFLVEQFNRILVTRTRIANFKPGIEVLVEKDNLLPFEEAKLYGHNAAHSLLGFVGALKGYTTMTELKSDAALMQIGRDALLKESGAALIKKYSQLEDELFTEAGFAAYTDDLLERIVNPHLGDTIARVVRDVPRKLEPDGRIFGTMRLVLDCGIEPRNMALGALAGIAELLKNAESDNLPEHLRFGDWRKLDEEKIERILHWLWNDRACSLTTELVTHIMGARERLEILTNA